MYKTKVYKDSACTEVWGEPFHGAEGWINHGRAPGWGTDDRIERVLYYKYGLPHRWGWKGAKEYLFLPQKPHLR